METTLLAIVYKFSVEMYRASVLISSTHTQSQTGTGGSSFGAVAHPDQFIAFLFYYRYHSFELGACMPVRG